jgi:hypothetical protein
LNLDKKGKKGKMLSFPNTHLAIGRRGSGAEISLIGRSDWEAEVSFHADPSPPEGGGGKTEGGDAFGYMNCQSKDPGKSGFSF